jgi:exopolyphosphatase/guanosine-5'-triphosphate,3'-diphosphate pyrophosphatase
VRVAAIDIGTNTALMLIAEANGSSFSILEDIHAIPRLGEDVDKTHVISEAAVHRLDEVLSRYQQIIGELGINIVDAVGTSALRDAENSNEVCDHIRRSFNIPVRLIPGDEEARLTYLGAVSDISTNAQLIGVVDIGGGSTEIALGIGKDYVIGRSMNIGAVRLTERSQDRADREKDIRENLKATFNLFPLPDRLVAVAGTATSVAAIKLGLETFDRERINGTVVTLGELDEIVELLYSISANELSGRYPVITKGRADILPAGALILYETVQYLRLDSFTASTRGLRYGVAIDAIRRTHQ